MSEEFDSRVQTFNSTVQTQLERTSKPILNFYSNECEKTRRSENIRIENLKRFLERKNIIDSSRSNLDISECHLDSVWSGVLDLKSTTTDPSKIMTKPSIGWDCNLSGCNIEADLPVPLDKKDEFKEELNNFDRQCAVSDIHIHTEAGPHEAHIHLICKSIPTSHLGEVISRLSRKTMKYRGHEVEEYPTLI